MTDQIPKLNIDYSRLQFNNPASFVTYAVKLTEQIKQHGAITKISYMQGDHKKQGKARVFLDDFKEITIPDPKKTKSKAKLAHLLWALSQCGKVPAHILFVGSKQYEVSSKHAQEHESKLQKEIRRAYVQQIVKDVIPDALTKSLNGILTRTLTDEQIQTYDQLPSDKKQLWREFTKYSTSSGRISADSFRNLEKETGLSRKEIFELNENYFAVRELDFEIDYGTVPFYDHHYDLIEKDKKIAQLEKNIKDLENRLSKHS